MYKTQKKGVKRMMTMKEKKQEAENIFAIYMKLPETEKIMLLSYSTALRDRALLHEESVGQQLSRELVAK